jgi:hypothetical protein
VYDADFGLGSVRYVYGVVSNMDGLVVINGAPRGEEMAGPWTHNGMDVDIHIQKHDMMRLFKGSALLPDCS